MRIPRASWSVVALIAALGCSSDPAPPAATACTPTCRAGFTCVAGACVSACNPACGATQQCVVTTTGPTCVGEGTDAGVTPGDVGSVTDVGSGSDVGSVTDVGSDAGAPMDVLAPTDVPATPTDVVLPTSDLPPLPPCGMSGQPCCGMNACYNGGSCVSGSCMAPAMRDPGECSRPEDCPMGQSCIGINQCSGSRGCFRCAAPPTTATGDIGAACTGPDQCRTGVCSNGRCTIACNPGDSGDAACNAARAGYACTGILYRSMAGAPVTTLGVCNQRCQRPGDCPAGFVCGPTLNYLADRMDFVCRPASMTATTPVGGACNPAMPTCQATLCLPTGMSTGYCTGVCVNDADCPAAAPVCDTLIVIRPSGRDQTTRGCHPRR